MSAPTAKGLPALVTTGDVAAALSWDPDTIRAHLVPHADWLEMSAKDRAGKVPFVKLGGRYKIPRWWLEDALAVVRPP